MAREETDESEEDGRQGEEERRSSLPAAEEAPQLEANDGAELAEADVARHPPSSPSIR